MSSPPPTIDPNDLERRRADGSVESISPRTFRINRRRLLNSSSEDSNATESSTDSIDLPKEPVSVEMGLYLGFSEAQARSFVRVWHNLGEDEWDKQERGEDFGEFVIEWIKMVPSDPNLPDDWAPFLRDKFGLHANLIDRMMDPTENYVRLREPPEYWVISLIAQRWYVYNQACEKLRQHGNPTQASGSVASQPSTPAQPPTPSKSSTEKPKLAQPYSATQGSGYNTSGSVSSPGYTILYKGVYEEQAKKFFPRGLSTNRPWTLDGNATLPGGDFNGESLCHYWTPQFMGAHAYARYKLKNNEHNQSVYVIQITVPNSWIESQRRLILDWPSDLFKQVVWNSRLMRPLGRGNVPQAEGFKFFIGDTTGGNASRFRRLSSCTEMTESVLMMTRPDVRVRDPHSLVSERIRQYAFSVGLGEDLVALRPQPDIKVLHFEQRHEVDLP